MRTRRHWARGRPGAEDRAGDDFKFAVFVLGEWGPSCSFSTRPAIHCSDAHGFVTDGGVMDVATSQRRPHR